MRKRSRTAPPAPAPGCSFRKAVPPLTDSRSPPVLRGCPAEPLRPPESRQRAFRTGATRQGDGRIGGVRWAGLSGAPPLFLSSCRIAGRAGEAAGGGRRLRRSGGGAFVHRKRIACGRSSTEAEPSVARAEGGDRGRSFFRTRTRPPPSQVPCAGLPATPAGAPSFCRSFRMAGALAGGSGPGENRGAISPGGRAPSAFPAGEETGTACGPILPPPFLSAAVSGLAPCLSLPWCLLPPLSRLPPLPHPKR